MQINAEEAPTQFLQNIGKIHLGEVMKTLIEDFYQYPTWSQWQVAVTQAERIFLWKCKQFLCMK